MRSPSYIFYTGHGNYHKQEISLNSPSANGNLAADGSDMRSGAVGGNYDGVDFVPPPPHLVNYSFINKNNNGGNNNGSGNNMNVATIGDHPYSNVIDQPESTATTRFNNFR